VLQLKSDKFKSAYGKLTSAKKDADQIATWMAERYYWGDVLSQLRGALINSEDDVKKKLSAQKPGVEAGIWIEQMTTLAGVGQGISYAQPVQNNGQPGGQYNPPGGYITRGAPQPAAQAAGATPDATADQGVPITLTCRAVDLTSVDSAANGEIAYAVENQFKACPIFDPKTTQLAGQTSAVDANGTFTFGVTVVLLNPLKL
jgi:hypothetical protein